MAEKQYKVALWPTALSAIPIAEIDTIAENAENAVLSAMKTNGTNYMGVVIVMSSEQQEWFYDATRHTGNNTLAYSRTGTSPRLTDKPFIWQPKAASELQDFHQLEDIPDSDYYINPHDESE